MLQESYLLGEYSMASVLVIGGGVSGLSVGIFCLLKGFDVKICEKHSVAGGNLTGWKRNGYYIDNCLHWLVGTNPNAKAFNDMKLLGIIETDTMIYQPECLYTVSVDGKKASLYRDLDKTRNNLIKQFPEDEEEIVKLFDAIELIQGFQHVKGYNHNEANSFIEVIKNIPALAEYYRLDIKGLAKRFKSPVMKHFISDMMMTADFTCLFFMVTVAAFCGDNAGIPNGGSMEMAVRMSNRFQNLGGELMYGKEAKQILINNHKAVGVLFDDNTFETADYIISSVDINILYEEFLKRKLPDKLLKLSKKENEAMFSSFQFALSCDSDELPFEDTYIISKVTEAFCENAVKVRKKYLNRQIIITEYGRCPEFSPEGHNVLQVMIYCSKAEARNFIWLKEKDSDRYKHLKNRLACEIKKIIEKELPELEGHLDIIDIWTPATYKRYVGSKNGTWMGFVLPSGKLPRVSGCRVKGVDNLFVSSQWIKAPGGLPIAISVGKKTANTIYMTDKINRKQHIKNSFVNS